MGLNYYCLRMLVNSYTGTGSESKEVLPQSTFLCVKTVIQNLYNFLHFVERFTPIPMEWIQTQ